MTEAQRIKLQHERLRQLLAEMDDELGPVSEAELERARKTWPIARKRARPTRSAR